jgi:type I site-specific restriction endonuclease
MKREHRTNSPPTLGIFQNTEYRKVFRFRFVKRLQRRRGLGDRDLAYVLVRMIVEPQQGLGLFVRSLVGLERDAAKQGFADFLSGRTLTANQIEFINLIINYLTEHGAMDPDRLYESPFTDFSPLGVEGLFKPADVTELFTGSVTFGTWLPDRESRMC